MKKLAVVILVLSAIIACVGLYRGWFTVNQARIQQDEFNRMKKPAKAKVQDIEKKIKDNVKSEK